MRAAGAWRDYQLLDASDGDRLERWGDYVLQRPDPQVIWQTPKTATAWQTVDAVYHRSEKGGGHWETFRPMPERWTIRYGTLNFIVSPTAFKHTGVFPEQAVNWALYKRLITGAVRPIKVLNLFGYTGGATLACAAAGAQVTHVDASRGIVGWARENAAESGLAEKPIRWIVDDCQKFTTREIRRQNLYDAVIMDPPSYGRGPNGEVWRLEQAIWPLLKLAADVLSAQPLFFMVNSYTTGLAPEVMGYMLEQLLPARFGGAVHGGAIGLPVAASGGVLPCGASCVWLPDGEVLD
ncbi:MAG: class I SAM-dependent methyltransferase [Oscillospiraceae bacterium]